MKVKRSFVLFVVLGVSLLSLADCFIDFLGHRRHYYVSIREPHCPTFCYRNQRKANSECAKEEGCMLQPCKRVTELGRIWDGLSCVIDPSFVRPKPTPSVSPSPRVCTSVPGGTIQCSCNDGAYSEMTWEFVDPNCGGFINMEQVSYMLDACDKLGEPEAMLSNIQEVFKEICAIEGCGTFGSTGSTVGCY